MPATQAPQGHSEPTSADAIWRRPRSRARRLVPIAALVAIGIGAAACGSSASTTTPTTTAAASGSGKAIVNLAKSSLGTILVTKSDFTLYYYTADTPTKIACTGSCAQSWPPLLFTGSGMPKGGTGVTGLGTIKRPGGGVQVTYKNKPLYTFTSDTPGHTTGQGVAGFQVLIVSGAKTSSSTTSTTSGGGGGY